MGTEGIITLGIGSAPDGLLWFFTLGLGISQQATGLVDLIAPARDFSLTAQARDFTLTAKDRG